MTCSIKAPRGSTDRLAPVDQPRGGPFEMRAVRSRTMGGLGGVLVFLKTAGMRSDAFSLENKLNRVMRGTGPEGFSDQRIGHTVEVIVVGDVIVDIRFDFLPLGILIGRCRQRL